MVPPKNTADEQRRLCRESLFMGSRTQNRLLEILYKLGPV